MIEEFKTCDSILTTSLGGDGIENLGPDTSIDD